MASGERLARRLDAAHAQKKDGRPGREVGGRLSLPDQEGERRQATSLLIRSAFSVARVWIGWMASPASFTKVSVRRELSATKRSNCARANSLCSWRNSLADLASARARTASAAFSTPSRLVSTTSWPSERAPSTAIL